MSWIVKQVWQHARCDIKVRRILWGLRALIISTAEGVKMEAVNFYLKRQSTFTN
jgi:hypothetical protein